MGSETGRISDSEQQMQTAAAQMLVNPSIAALLQGQHLPPGPRRADAADAAIALDTFERAAILPLTSACIDDAAGRQVACGHDAGSVIFPPALRETFSMLASGPGPGPGPGAGAGTHKFASPVSARPSVSFVVALRGPTRLLGLVHFDMSAAMTHGSHLIVSHVAVCP